MMRNNKGLSLMELLLAITIGMIMVGFITISMTTVSRNSVNRMCDKVYTACNSARNTSLTKGSDNGYLNLYYKDGYLYSNIGLNCTSSFSPNLSTQDWKKIGKVDEVEMHIVPLTNGKICSLRFKQSTGELDGIRFPGASEGYNDWQDFEDVTGSNNNDFRIETKIGSKEKTVCISKYGKIYKK